MRARVRVMRWMSQAMVPAVLLALTSMAGAATPADEGLVAHWSFDAGAGDVARDLSGNGHELEYGLLLAGAIELVVDRADT
ncbi:MAG: hypothetical protein ACP5KN_20025, partial [Armatimonadota bacterium]